MKVQVIVGSVRQGQRTSLQVAKWVASEANKIDGNQAEIVDLMDYPMPFFDESGSPQFIERHSRPEVQKWLDKLAEADAYILVTPEYNRTTSGVLKNALDYIDFQFARKPVALVGHGSSGGAQAIASLRLALAGLLTVGLPKATFLIGASNFIDADGKLSEEEAAKPYGPLTALKALLEDLRWYSDALATARAKDQ